MKTLLLLLSFGKLSKLLLSAGSMLLSLFTYSLLYGWRYSAGFLGMLLVHEMGHFVAARKRGMDVGLPTFVPFVGAWVSLKDQPLSAETEAYIAIAGPIVGSAAAFVVFLMAIHTNESLYFAIAYAGFMLNLFNLIPLSPLDGGRIMSAITPKLWIVGIPLLVGAFMWHPSPMIILIGVLALPQVYSLFTDKERYQSDYFNSSGNVRFTYAAQYLFLVIALLVFGFEAHQHLVQK